MDSEVCYITGSSRKSQDLLIIFVFTEKKFGVSFYLSHGDRKKAFSIKKIVLFSFIFSHGEKKNSLAFHSNCLLETII